MAGLRALLGRVRRDPRLLGSLAVVAVLLAAAVLDVPSRLGRLAPESAPTAAPARPTPTPQPTRVAELSNLTNDDNEGLDRCTPNAAELARCGQAPALGQGRWLNTPDGRAVSLDDLRGSVVVVDFFAASCADCRRDSRYLRAWAAQYDDEGLEIVGVHAPEFAFEKKSAALRQRLRDLSIRYPVLMDNRLATLTDYRSQVLPAKYLVDRSGTVRAISFGEGGYERFEDQIRTVLTESTTAATLPSRIGVLKDGSEPAPGTTQQINFGDSRGTRYDNESDDPVGDATHFRLPPDQPDGTFSLGGLWRIGTQLAEPRSGAVSRVTFRARKAYQLVAGTGELEVTTSEGVTRRIRVDGPADLVQVYGAPDTQPETLTVRYSGRLEVYAFSFG